MPRRLAKPFVVLLALAVLAAALSACAIYKFGSLKLSQPGGIGSVRIHFEICGEAGEDPSTCTSSKTEGQLQAIVGIAVPPGTSAPATFTAAPLSGGDPIVFSRSDQAAQALAEGTAGSEEPWPPAGTERIGYLSTPITETKGAMREWSVDADFGLPPAPDGGSFAGPFATTIAYGLRGVGGEAGSADRPVFCVEDIADASSEDAFCTNVEGTQIGTSDLRISAPAQVPVYVGGKATISFPFDFATTATPSPSFVLTATSTLPKAELALSSPTFTPGAPDPTTHRSPLASQTVTVTVPKKGKPGLYDVTLTAATPQGGTVSQVVQLKVSKPKLKLGGVKLNRAKGTATLSVKIPGAGTVTASGKGIAKVKEAAKKATKPKTVKLTIKAKGKAKEQLTEEGAAKVSAKLTFKPLSGIAVNKTKKLTLKKN